MSNQIKSRQNHHQDLLAWILRKENAGPRLRPRQAQVSLRITLNNNGMVRKQSLNETADFQLGVEKDTSCTQLDYIQSQPRTTSQSTTYKMNQQPTSMCTECKFDLKNPSDLAIHLTEQHQQQERIYQCLRCSYKTKAIKNLREHEGGQHSKYEENIDFVKERGTENPFKCMKCDHRTNVKAHITRHLFKKHSSAIITEGRRQCQTNMQRELDQK